MKIESIFDLIDGAQRLVDGGEIDKAIAEYKYWLSDESDGAGDFAAYFNLAILYLNIGQIGLAQKALRKCVECKPDFNPAVQLCVDPSLDLLRPMAARTQFEHGCLRVGWLGEARDLTKHSIVTLLGMETSINCEHTLYGWGAGLPKNAKNITELTDDAAACFIRSQELDVLIDIMGWAEASRPRIIAYHPASLVVSMVWPPQSSGLMAIDYAVLYQNAIPSNEISYFEEEVLLLEGESPIGKKTAQEKLWQLELTLKEVHSKLPLRKKLRVPSPESLRQFSPPESRGRRYVIAAPPYQHTSAGIRVLYDLQKWLVRAGWDAMVCTWFPGYPVEAFKDDIVIYPEVAPGNLLKARRVVRYILNIPGKLGNGEKVYAQSELLVAYNEQLAPYADGFMLQVPSVEPFFHKNGAIRDKDAMYVGKGRNLGMHPTSCVEITKIFPATRTELADFLRTVRILYSYDNFTMLAYEADLCGCRVVIIGPEGKMEELKEISVPGIGQFMAQLQEFIEVTQNL